MIENLNIRKLITDSIIIKAETFRHIPVREIHVFSRIILQQMAEHFYLDKINNLISDLRSLEKDLNILPKDKRDFEIQKRKNMFKNILKKQAENYLHKQYPQNIQELLKIKEQLEQERQQNKKKIAHERKMKEDQEKALKYGKVKPKVNDRFTKT